jgi:hypothetical protein
VQRVLPARARPKALRRVAVDEAPAGHRMVEAADLVPELGEQLARGRVDDLLVPDTKRPSASASQPLPPPERGGPEDCRSPHQFGGASFGRPATTMSSASPPPTEPVALGDRAYTPLRQTARSPRRPVVPSLPLRSGPSSRALRAGFRRGRRAARRSARASCGSAARCSPCQPRRPFGASARVLLMISTLGFAVSQSTTKPARRTQWRRSGAITRVICAQGDAASPTPTRRSGCELRCPQDGSPDAAGIGGRVPTRFVERCSTS